MSSKDYHLTGKEWAQLPKIQATLSMYKKAIHLTNKIIAKQQDSNKNMIKI